MGTPLNTRCDICGHAQGDQPDTIDVPDRLDFTYLSGGFVGLCEKGVGLRISVDCYGVGGPGKRAEALLREISSRYNTKAALVSALRGLLDATATDPEDCKSHVHHASMMEHAQETARAAIRDTEGAS